MRDPVDNSAAGDDRLLVAVDVDGTLLDTEFTDDLRSREREAMRAVRASGHILALCTGRNRRSLAGVLRPVREEFADLPLVMLNGALVDGGSPRRVLAHNTLAHDVLRRVVEIFRQHKAVAMVYDTEERGGRLYHEDREANSVLARYLDRRRSTVGAIVPVDDLLEALPPEALEVGTIDELDTVRRLSEALREQLGDGIKVVNTETLLARGVYGWAEVFHPACSKATGARMLADEYGVAPGRIVAIGDNYNDLELFDAAGWSVAMGNAPEAVRLAADDIAPAVSENGAAVILEAIAAGDYPPPDWLEQK